MLIPYNRPVRHHYRHFIAETQKVNDYKFQVKRDPSWTIKHYYYLNETMKH